MKTEQKIMDSIKTFEDAVAATGRPNVPDFSNVPEDLREYFESQYKLVVITEALNDGWNPDWDNSSEWKYFPWFKMSPSGFACDGAGDWHSSASAGAGSRLCFKTEAMAEYASEQFIDLWKKLMLK